MKLRKISGAEIDFWVLGRPGPLQWVRGAIFMYLAFVLLAHWMAPGMMYQPPRPGYAADDPGVIMLTTRSGDRIAAIHHDNPKAKYTVLYSHGNATDIGYADSFMVRLRDAGFSVFCYDYRGYGHSEGSPSEAKTYEDIRQAYHYLTEELMIPEQSILLYGSSVGSGPTVHLAAQVRPGGIILENPLLSAYRVITHASLFPFDKYRNIDKIGGIRAPLLIIHGEKDRVISPKHAKKLYELAPEPKQIVEIPGAGHNDLFVEHAPMIMEHIKHFPANTEAP